MKTTPLERITRVMEHYRKRGVNSERVNNIYRKILKLENK